MSPDFVNAVFEFGGSLFVVNNIRVVLKDRMVKGVSVVSVAFFAVWGIWNLFYYPYLQQWWSFYGGVAIVVTNIVWIHLMLYYRKHPNGAEFDWMRRWATWE